MSTDVALYRRALKLLRVALSNESASFREGQWDAIKCIVEERARVLVVQRTGWGKSIVYFIATRLLRDAGQGSTLLISPLLSLMRDQLRAADRLKLRAETVNSTNREDWGRIYALMNSDEIDILLVSPERLANDEFRRQVLSPLASSFGFFVVDEAHCISDWGHDFRPDYLRIARVLQALPPTIPALATTATANDRVVEDVKSQLGPQVLVSRGPLVRESLRLQNIVLPTQAARLAWLAEHVPTLPGSGIIYALTIGDVQRIAEWLQLNGIDAHAYWGAQESTEREILESRLLNNHVKALVATTALGMGFDKPDLGFVIHFQRPGSVVHYYQQVGRAGRALPQAYGILLSGIEDTEITEYFIKTAFPPDAHVDLILDALRSADDGLSTPGLERQVNLTHGEIEKVLKTLSVKSPAPVEKRGPKWYATAVRYYPDPAKIRELTARRYAEQDRMNRYIQSTECLMQFLARELDDPTAAPCGRCAACLGGPLLPETYTPQRASQALDFLRRGIHPIDPRLRCIEGAVPSLGWQSTIPVEERFAEGRALSLWGDGAWGTLVRQGKRHDGYFSDDLVEASYRLITGRWRPDPPPTWLTYVPSTTHPQLVPVFAAKLAARLRLPLVAALRKTCVTASQKQMENSFQQAHNLDGAFQVVPTSVHSGPVLLLDDMVDSRWTFTVTAALLRRAGSGVVYPFALADTSRGD